MSRPAARLTDMHVCPQITVLVPHVGGPVVGPGEPRVLIGGMPAARVGDFCVCVGPPDVIAMGSFTVLIGGMPAARMGDMTAHGGAIVGGFPTVLIGDVGGGAGTPAAFTMGAARASGAALTSASCASEAVLEQLKDSPILRTGDPEKKHFVEIELVDREGKPVAHERFRVVPPGGKPIEGFLDDAGFTRIGGIDPGTCVISLPDLDAATWKPEKGDPGKLARPLPAPRILPGIGPVTLTRVPGVGVPSIGPVKLTAKGPTLPSVGPVTLTLVSRTRTPSIGPVRLSVIGAPGGARPGVRSNTITLRPTTIAIGEPVEATFQLDCKPGTLSALKDGDQFAELTFRMEVGARAFAHVTHQRGGDSAHAEPPFIKVAGGIDDAVVRVVFSFVGNDPSGKPRFRVGDKIDLFCFYQGTDFVPASSEPTLLGTITIR